MLVLNPVILWFVCFVMVFVFCLGIVTVYYEFKESGYTKPVMTLCFLFVSSLCFYLFVS